MARCLPVYACVTQPTVKDDRRHSHQLVTSQAQSLKTFAVAKDARARQPCQAVVVQLENRECRQAPKDVGRKRQNALATKAQRECSVGAFSGSRQVAEVIDGEDAVVPLVNGTCRGAMGHTRQEANKYYHMPSRAGPSPSHLVTSPAAGDCDLHDHTLVLSEQYCVKHA